MVKIAPDSSKDQNGLEHPQTPFVYPDPESLNIYGALQTHVSEHSASPHPYFSASSGHQAVYQPMSSAEQTLEPFSLDQAHGAPRLGEAFPVFPSSPPPPPYEVPQKTATPNHPFVQYPPESGYQQRPRGTTGHISCANCTLKFTQQSSLRRHNKHSKCGKRAASTKHKLASSGEISDDTSVSAESFPVPAISPRFGSQNIETASMACSDAPVGAELSRSLTREQGEAWELNSNVPTVSAASALVDLPSDQSASQTSGSNTLGPYPQPSLETRSYIPQSGDTSADHTTFFCDICPGSFPRRDILQLHKASIHGLKEMPYPSEPGSIDRPSHLGGVTLDHSTKHSVMALRAFEGGGLSPSPCQRCKDKGEQCVVNPFTSSKCSLCCHHDDGKPCGAAGVNYRKPRGVQDLQ